MRSSNLKEGVRLRMGRQRKDKGERRKRNKSEEDAREGSSPNAHFWSTSRYSARDVSQS